MFELDMDKTSEGNKKAGEKSRREQTREALDNVDLTFAGYQYGENERKPGSTSDNTGKGGQKKGGTDYKLLGKIIGKLLKENNIGQQEPQAQAPQTPPPAAVATPPPPQSMPHSMPPGMPNRNPQSTLRPAMLMGSPLLPKTAQAPESMPEQPLPQPPPSQGYMPPQQNPQIPYRHGMGPNGPVKKPSLWSF